MKRLSLIFLLLIASAFYGCERISPLSRTKALLGTQVTITVHDRKIGVSREDAYQAIGEAFKEMYRIQRMIKWDELYSLNSLAGTRETEISEELISIINEAYDISEQTEGAFRPDLGPLVDLWGFGRDSIHIPNEYELDSAMTIIDNSIFSIIEYNFAYLEPMGAKIELGGFAKGYAVDRAVEVLQQEGILAGIVEAGGDLRCFGKKRDGEPWRIAIRHPRQLDEFYTVLSLDSGAVATSGDYEQFVEYNGYRYHHILDPKTGFPAKNSISTTVITDRCAIADGYATGLFIKGPIVGIRLANQIGLHALIIADNGDGLIDARTTDFRRIEADK